MYYIDSSATPAHCITYDTVRQGRYPTSLYTSPCLPFTPPIDSWRYQSVSPSWRSDGVAQRRQGRNSEGKEPMKGKAQLRPSAAEGATSATSATASALKVPRISSHSGTFVHCICCLGKAACMEMKSILLARFRPSNVARHEAFWMPNHANLGIHNDPIPSTEVPWGLEKTLKRMWPIKLGKLHAAHRYLFCRTNHNHPRKQSENTNEGGKTPQKKSCQSTLSFVRAMGGAGDVAGGLLWWACQGPKRRRMPVRRQRRGAVRVTGLAGRGAQSLQRTGRHWVLASAVVHHTYIVGA